LNLYGRESLKSHDINCDSVQVFYTFIEGVYKWYTLNDVRVIKSSRRSMLHAWARRETDSRASSENLKGRALG